LEVLFSVVLFFILVCVVSFWTSEFLFLYSISSSYSAIPVDLYSIVHPIPYSFDTLHTEFGRRRQDNVEVLFPESQVVGSGNPSSVADNNDLASTSSAFVDSATLVEKVIAKLPAEVHAHATDSKRKAKSQDPGWKFGWWPDPTKKDFIRCIFCLKVVPSRIKRFKQHLVGGFSDTTKCSMVPEVVSNDMYAYLKRNTRLVLSVESEEGGQKDGDATEPEQKVHEPSSETKHKQAKKKATQATISSFVVSAHPTQKSGKSVAAMFCKTPEEVVADRHKNKTTQSTLEACTKKGKEAKQIVNDHVADFLYENKIPLHVVNSRSWEVMLESIGQFGPGYSGPSYHDVRVPWLDRVVDRATTLRSKHEQAWKEYGCTVFESREILLH
jgi:hypothetical protein